MTANLLQQAIACDDGDQAAKLLQDALGSGADNDRNGGCRCVSWNSNCYWRWRGRCSH